MAILRPFRALRPRSDKASVVAAVPYDVVSTEEARTLAGGNALSFLHVSRPEIDLPDGTDPHGREVYDKAAENFESLRRLAPLERSEAPRLYVYRLRMAGHEQTGVAGVCSLDEYDRGIVRKHERTRRDKEDDRTRHMIALRAQTGPVFLTYRDRPEIGRLVDRARNSPPLYDFTASDGVSHTIWELSPEDSDRLSEQFRPVPLLYIADGHHRAASASRAREELRARSAESTGEEAFEFFLAVAFPAGQVKILPYNRAIRDLNRLSPADFLAALRESFAVSESAPASPSRKGEVSFYLDGRWYGLTLPAPSGDDPIEALDAELLQRRVLEPILKIGDVRTDKRIEFIGGVRGTAALENLVETGRFAVAFSMYPVSLNELMAVSDANQIMPPKSTWFEPKLRDGLLIHAI